MTDLSRPPLPAMLPVRGILVCLILSAIGCASYAAAQEGALEVLRPPGSQRDLPPLFEFPEVLAPESSTSVIDGALDEDTRILKESEALIAPPEAYEWYQASYWFGPAPWDVGVNFGLNGSEGENRSQSIASGAYVKRDSQLWTLDSRISYNMTAANSVETQNNALVDARVDRKLDKSPWSLFILNQTLYDEFQPFNLRLSLNSGVGYRWVDTESFNLIGRFGAGASREFGGPDDEWAAEALFGLDYEYLISAKQRLTAKVDYFPEWEDFGQYRVVSDAGWEIDLDRPKNVSIRFSVNDRYDSTPNGVDPNLVNYAVLLNWKL